MRDNFKPLLAPNDVVDLDKIVYPLLGSRKLDGIRCIFKDGEILSRSLKPIQNKQLREKLAPLAAYSKESDTILDGEIYSPLLTFQEITGFVMSHDLTDKKSIKRYGCVKEIPDHLKFYCFDIIGTDFNVSFEKRIFSASLDMQQFNDIATTVVHKWIYSKEEIAEYFEEALKHGCEGLILRDPNGRYKCGRGTIKEGLLYKYKPFVTIDSKIIDIIQATAVDPNAEKKINELGYSVTSKKKSDRKSINRASAFLVGYKGKSLKVTIAMNNDEKEKIWANKDKYIGKILEYKFMEIGMKKEGLPRHPVSIRIRYDQD